VFPASPIGFGDYPYIVDSTLVVPVILATARLLKGGGLLTESALIAAAVLSIWVTHGLEIITAVAVGGAFWLGLLAARRRAALRAVCTGLAAAGAAAAVGYLITRSPAIPRPNIPVPAAYNEAVAYLSGHTGAGPASVLAVFTGTELTTLAGILLVVGVAALILRREARWLIVALAIPLLCILDILGPELLHRLWIAIYPWSVEDRLLGLEFFVVPIIAGVGAVAIIDAIGRLMPSAPNHRVRVLTLALGGLSLSARSRRGWPVPRRPSPGSSVSISTCRRTTSPSSTRWPPSSPKGPSSSTTASPTMASGSQPSLRTSKRNPSRTRASTRTTGE